MWNSSHAKSIFAHLDIVWVAFVMQLCILLNCIETNLLVLLAYSDIAAFVMQLCILLNCIETNLLVLLAYSDIAATAAETATTTTTMMMITTTN